MIKFKQFFLESIKSNYDDLVVTSSTFSDDKFLGRREYFSIIDKNTKGKANIKIGSHFNQDLGTFDGEELTIVEFYASPLSDRIYNKDNKGGGFGRNVFSKIFEICSDRNIEILSIFAPLEDSRNILKHYIDIGLLIPIPYSKAVYGDWHTSFKINKSAAMAYSAKVKAIK